MNYKNNIVFGLLLLCNSVFSQNFNIEGIISDSISQKAISYAFVRLYTSDNQLLEGVLSDSTGSFSFKKIPKIHCNLKIDCFGYHSKTIFLNIDLFKTNDNHIILNNIYLQQNDIQLQTVVIKTDALIQQTVDKTVYTVDSSFLVDASNALDVVKHIPEISVDYVNNNISLKGYDNCLILINGIYKESEIVDIRSLNPNDIQIIEIITNPPSDIPSQYDGVINIKLKQKLSASFFIYSEISWRPWLKALDPFLNFAYSKNKVRFGVNYYYMLRRYKIDTDIDRIQDDSSAIYHSHSGKIRPFFEDAHILKVYLDYYISPKSYLHFSMQQTLSNRKEVWEETTTNVVSIIFDSLFLTTFSKQFYYVGDYTVYYRQSFKTTEQALSVSANAQYMNADYHYDYDLIKINDINSCWHNNERGIRNAYNFKIDYTHPFANHNSLTLGGYSFYQNFNSKYLSNISNEKSLYQDVKSLLYFDYRFRIKNIDFRIGFKTEYYQTWQDSLRGQYFTYLPTLIIQKRYADKHTLRFNYRATSNYPSLWNLRPYIVKNDLFNYYQGNPSLKPQVIHTADLAYTYRSRPFTANVRLYANKTINSINSVAQLDRNNVKHTTTKNVNGRFRTGLSGYFTLSLFDEMWEISPNFNLFWEKFNHHTNFNGSVELETYLYLPFHIIIYVTGGYTGKRLLYQGYTEPMWSINQVGIITRFLDGKLSFMIAYCEPFHHPKEISVFEYDEAMEKISTRSNTNTLTFRIIYSFNKGKRLNIQSDIDERIGKDVKN